MKIAFGAGESLNFNANFIVYVELQRKRSKHRKTFRIKLLLLWKNKERHRLKAVVACAKFETGQTFSHVQTDSTTANIVGPTMLGDFASVCT